MGTTAEKLTYLNTTKAQIKDGINRLGGELTNLDTFREYKEALDDIYDKLPKVTGTGSDLSLTPTLKGGMNILPLGNAEQQTYTGKNLINVTGFSKEENGITFTNNNDGTILVNGTATAQANFYVNTSFNVELNQSYALSGCPASGSINSYALWSNDDGSAQDNGSGVIFTPTTTNQSRISLRIRIQSGTVCNNLLFKPMLESGSSVTSWEPYVGGIPSPNPSYPQPIKVVTGDNQVVVQNKNLFNYTVFDNLTLQENGSVKAGTGFNDVDSKIFKGKPNTQYTISMRNTNMELDDTGFSVGFPNYVNTTTTGYYTFTTDSKGEIEYKIGARGNSVANQYEKYIQIEEGSQATSSVAHAEQSYTLHLSSLELCKIGDYQDVITGSKDNWKVVRKVGKHIFTGEETIAKQYAQYNLFRIDIPEIFIGVTGAAGMPVALLCNYLTKNTMNAIIQGIGIGFRPNENQILINNGISTSKEELVSWFENNDVYALFALETPTETPVTDTSLINELNGLQDLLSYDGTTNITIISASNNAQMLAQVSALKGE